MEYREAFPDVLNDCKIALVVGNNSYHADIKWDSYQY